MSSLFVAADLSIGKLLQMQKIIDLQKYFAVPVCQVNSKFSTLIICRRIFEEKSPSNIHLPGGTGFVGGLAGNEIF